MRSKKINFFVREETMKIEREREKKNITCILHHVCRDI